MVTSNLPFEEWKDVFGSERLTGALLDHKLPIGAISLKLTATITDSAMKKIIPSKTITKDIVNTTKK